MDVMEAKLALQHRISSGLFEDIGGVRFDTRGGGTDRSHPRLALGVTFSNVGAWKAAGAWGEHGCKPAVPSKFCSVQNVVHIGLERIAPKDRPGDVAVMRIGGCDAFTGAGGSDDSTV
jgi:hypothetical protein